MPSGNRFCFLSFWPSAIHSERVSFDVLAPVSKNSLAPSILAASMGEKKVRESPQNDRNNQVQDLELGGGFKYFYILIPIWEKTPKLANIFQVG